MDTETKISPEVNRKILESRYRFFTLIEEIKFNVLFSLCLPTCLQEFLSLRDTVEDLAVLGIYNLTFGEEDSTYVEAEEQEQINCFMDDASLDAAVVANASQTQNELYVSLCQAFKVAVQNEKLVKTCKEHCNHQIREEGRELIEAIETFFRLIGDRMNVDADDQRKREDDLIVKYRKNEKYKQRIITVLRQMEQATEKHARNRITKIETIKQYKSRIENAIKTAETKRVRFETDNKNELTLYLKYFENDLSSLENNIEITQAELNLLRMKNDVEIENIKKDVEKKEVLLLTQNRRYGHDMLNRYNEKKSLLQNIEYKKMAYEKLKENVAWSEKYLEQLDLEEKDYLKREFYDKLDAIKEKIALRAITNFLRPYIIVRFGVRKKPKSPKPKKIKKKLKK